MKKFSLPALFALLAFPALASEPAPAGPPLRFFAALSMTKMQVNSAMPDVSGAFLRLPNGQWQHFGGDQIKWVNTVAVSPADPAVVYLGCGNGILRSRDNGRTWRLTTDWHVADVFALQVDPTDATRLYAATGWGIWRSTDGGDTWIESDRGLSLAGKFTQCIVLDRTDPTRLIAGTDLGLFVSTDRADTWTRLDGGPRAPIFHVEQSGSDPRLWIVGTQGEGFQVSTDNGETWANAAPALARANVYGAAADPTDPGRFAAAGWTQGVRISLDGGKTWRDATRGLPTAHVSALMFDPTHPGRLWASTFEEGTYYSDDFGKTWRIGGLYGAYVSEMKFLPAKM
jgi:hypothetical protein